MNKQLDYTLAALRRSCDNSYPWSVTPAEAGLLVAEVERLRAEVEAAHAEAVTVRSWAEEAAGAENANAEDARKERAAVVAYLRDCALVSAQLDAPLAATNFQSAASAIERGEHRREACGRRPRRRLGRAGLRTGGCRRGVG
jgi:hypothetical protein